MNVFAPVLALLLFLYLTFAFNLLLSVTLPIAACLLSNLLILFFKFQTFLVCCALSLLPSLSYSLPFVDCTVASSDITIALNEILCAVALHGNSSVLPQHRL